MSYTKFWVGVLAAVLAAVVPGLAEGPLDAMGWFNVVVLAAGAIMIYNASNDVPGWRYAKLIASAVSAVVVVLISVWEGGVTTAEWLQVAIALLGALGVGTLPNGPSQPVD